MTGTTREALAFARAQHAHPGQSWYRRCLEFVRTAWQLPGISPTAYSAWLSLDPSDQHVGGDPADAPVGAPLFYKGADPAGHVMLAGRPFPSHVDAGWSNDLVTAGAIDKVDRNAPVTHWDHRYLGWSDALNGYDLPVGGRAQGGSEHQPAAPRHPRRYIAVAHAIQRLEGELDAGDLTGADRQGLRRDVAHLRALYAELRK